MGGLIGLFAPGAAARAGGDPERLSEAEAFRGERRSWTGDGALVTAYRWPWEPSALASDGRLVVAIQGELFLPGGRGGAEALLERLRASGTRGLSGLDGEFAGLAWDVQTRELTLFRDAFGTRPLFFAESGGALGVGTEIRQAARAAGVPLRADRRAASREAAGIPTTGRETLWSGISRVLPSEVLRFGGRGRESAALWEIPAVTGSRRAGSEVARELPAALRRAAGRRGGRQVLLLSGGLDSTAIAAAAPDRFSCALTISYPGFECDDTGRARSVAERTGIAHEALDVLGWGPVRCLAETRRDCDQPPGMTAYQVRPAMERVRQLGGEVAVLGLGGDDFFLPSAAALADVLPREGPVAALRAVTALVRGNREGRIPLRPVARHAWSSVLAPLVRHALAPAFDTGRRPPLLGAWDPRGERERWRDVSTGWWIALGVLARAWSGSAREVLEQLSARAGVGLAFPFFDREVALLATSARADVVLGPRRRKELLAGAFRELLPARIVDDWRGPLAPEPAVREVLRHVAAPPDAGEAALGRAVRAWREMALRSCLAGQEE